MRYRISDTSLGVFLEVGLKGGKLGALLEERKISNRCYCLCTMYMIVGNASHADYIG